MRIAIQMIFLVGLLCGLTIPLFADEVSEECQIGVMVKEITAALKTPENPESFEIIVKYGMDSRYYVMIRGWLTQELRGVSSQLGGSGVSAAKLKLQQKAAFLKKVIRRIDLE